MKMLMESSDLRENSIKFKQGKKFSSRRLCRETSVINSVVEVYYGGASVSVPFRWESQPGTPKVKLPEKPLPPVLTPPPSGASVSVPFHLESQPGTPKVKLPEKPLPPVLTSPLSSFPFYSKRKPIKNPSKPTLMHAILSKLLGRKTSRPLSRSSSALSSSSSFSLLSSSCSSFRSVPSSRFPNPNVPRKSQLSSPGSSFRSRIGKEEQPVLCFGSRNSGSHGCHRT